MNEQSDTSANERMGKCEMYACVSTLVFPSRVARPHLTVTWQALSSSSSSSISSSRTLMFTNSPALDSVCRMSASVAVSLHSSWKVSIVATDR